MKLKANTSLIIIIAAAVLLEVISAVQYYYTRSLLADELENRAESELTTKAVIVKNSLNMSETSLRGHIWDVKRNLSHPDSVFGAAEWVLRTHPKLVGCGIAFVPYYYPEKGRLFEPYAYRENDEVKTMQAAGDNHDYTKSGFYKQGILADSPIWTDPYIDDIFRIPMVSYTVPIQNENKETIAVFALDIPISILGDTLNYRHIYPSSYDILLTENGEFIAGPNEDFVQREDVEMVIRIINDSTVTKTLSKSGRSWIATFYDSEDHEKGYVFFTYFKGEPRWQIAVVCYDDEVYGKLRTMRRNIGLLMLAGLLILSLIVLYFARSNRKLQTANLAKERIDSELRIATNIQKEMLPEQSPQTKRDDIDIFGSLVPAREVGGDLFDYFIRDEKLFFCIGDVSGKGVPSAMVMAVIHSLFRMASAHENNPARMMQTINETSCEGNESNMFVTLFIGVLDLPTGHLHYCNAGHDAPVIVGREALPIKANIPLGLFDEFTFEMQETKLEEGTMLFLYTDGLTEAKNSQRKQFERNRVMTVLRDSADLSPEQLLKKMTGEVHAFVGDAEQSDDLTMLAIRYTPVCQELVLDEQLILQNDIHQVAQLNAFVKQTIGRLDIEPSLSKKLQLAVEEAVVNVMEYAYPAGVNGEISLQITSDGQSMKFIIKDHGGAFDPTMKEKADTTLSIEDRPIGGLGILLVRELMDSINYERMNGMNVLTLKKELVINH
jgi:sigma-B regulation protein RsbU (phosphoserine phosphatase)